VKHRIRTGIAASFAMLILILDTKTALSGANEGIQLCVKTVIPSLLPFIFLSNLLTSALTGTKSKVLQLFGRFMGMPQGCESLFIIGALGGYPTGAQAVSSAYSNGQLSKKDAQRLLGFCSNAGPSFLFGITAAQFPDLTSVWLLWLIHLLSAFFTGILLPGGSRDNVVIQQGNPLSAVQSLRKSINSMAQICGWVILFRILISFSTRWFLWLFDDNTNVLINGTVELSLGCVSLSKIKNLGMRFLAGAALLGFGGLCVLMQTASCVGSLGLGKYIPGKIMQCCISIILAATVQNLLYPPDQRCPIHFILYAISVLAIAIIRIFMQKSENRSRNLQPLVV